MNKLSECLYSVSLPRLGPAATAVHSLACRNLCHLWSAWLSSVISEPIRIRRHPSFQQVGSVARGEEMKRAKSKPVRSDDFVYDDEAGNLVRAKCFF